MDEIFVAWALCIYFIAYTGAAFGWRTYRVYRATGHNPFVLARGDDVDGYVGRAFAITVFTCLIVVLIPAVMPRSARVLGPLPGLREMFVLPGALLLLTSFVGVIVAQSQMGSSWRVGIDKVNRTNLVDGGLFAYSRNPIFLSMRATLLGLVGVAPSVASVAVLVAGEILIQVQVRLEEAHLAERHGKSYAEYRERVPRWWRLVPRRLT